MGGTVKMASVDCHCSIAGGKGKKVKEMIITGPEK
jgi:hypothetical protein